ncbi:carboxypeptidase-like regulatory domain-containing protein [Hymenobacter negativus]|uniref:Carboxypeptidase regulatory-like domain-containing protein n=1 Tax=Hymenobacter negativus TaxID=2795026 RepID=A0ABS0QA80_9BACT|nr:carboxypeptidase-like regulatory domain-containing protein [Hymenobacter negativus]MBH8559574.1 carboxypeptidase regulatory-like domain-containing protein [Hymenobacter negativus]
MNCQLLLPTRPVAGWRRGLAATAALLGFGAVAVPAGHAQAISTAGPIQRQVAGPVLEAADSATQQRKEVNNVTELITISGTVVNQHGSPVGGLEVSLDSENAFQEVVATTDAKGSFRFVVAPEALDSTTAIQVTVFSRLGLHYQYATAPIDKVSNQPYLLRLQKRHKPSRHTMGMFR